MKSWSFVSNSTHRWLVHIWCQIYMHYALYVYSIPTVMVTTGWLILIVFVRPTCTYMQYTLHHLCTNPMCYQIQRTNSLSSDILVLLCDIPCIIYVTILCAIRYKWQTFHLYLYFLISMSVNISNKCHYRIWCGNNNNKIPLTNYYQSSFI